MLSVPVVCSASRRSKYRGGVGLQLDVLQAQVDLVLAEGVQVQAFHAQRAAWIEIHRLLGRSGDHPIGAPSAPEARIRIRYNPGLRFAFSVVLSMIGTAGFMVGVILPAAGAVRERERGTLEQIMVSPLTTGELMLAKTLPTLVIGLLSLGPSLLIARAFGLTFAGSLTGLIVVSAVFLVGAIGIGLLIAALVRTLQQALFAAFFVLFPILFLSGTVTPVESMPAGLRPATPLSPLRHYFEALEALFLKGSGLSVLWPHLLWMAAIGAGLPLAGALLFRRRLA